VNFHNGEFLSFRMVTSKTGVQELLNCQYRVGGVKWQTRCHEKKCKMMHMGKN